MTVENITVQAFVAAPVEAVWQAYATPEDIMQWNSAADDWHTPAASVDLREGGHFSSRMEARDGSMGFDFAGTYTRIEPLRRIDYTFGDRHAQVTFTPVEGGVQVAVTFEAEAENALEQQRQGWQAILDRFARYTAGR